MSPLLIKVEQGLKQKTPVKTVGLDRDLSIKKLLPKYQASIGVISYNVALGELHRLDLL